MHVICRTATDGDVAVRRRTAMCHVDVRRRAVSERALTFDLIFIGWRGIVMDYPGMPSSVVEYLNTISI